MNPKIKATLQIGSKWICVQKVVKDVIDMGKHLMNDSMLHIIEKIDFIYDYCLRGVNHEHERGRNRNRAMKTIKKNQIVEWRMDFSNRRIEEENENDS